MHSPTPHPACSVSYEMENRGTASRNLESDLQKGKISRVFFKAMVIQASSQNFPTQPGK